MNDVSDCTLGPVRKHCYGTNFCSDWSI